MIAFSPSFLFDFFFEVLYDELGHCTETEQNQKISEMNSTIDEMDSERLLSFFNKSLFDKISMMTGETRTPWEKNVLLLKHLGYRRVLKGCAESKFYFSMLRERFEKKINEEDKKKDERNERLLVDLCECYLLVSCQYSSEIICICVPCILKAALRKEENEETKKEVEMALLSLSHVNQFIKTDEELYFNEIKEIILNHQEHHNLTWLAYQSAWKFLMNRFDFDKRLEGVIVNELHFIRVATNEPVELAMHIDWKRKKEEKGEREEREELALERWLYALAQYFYLFESTNEEYIGLFGCPVQIFRVAKDCRREIGEMCIQALGYASRNRAVKFEHLVKSGAVEAASEWIIQLSSCLNQICLSLMLLKEICWALKKKMKNENDEAKRKDMKRKVSEKMEEEGYEDCLIGFHNCIKSRSPRYMFGNLEECCVYF
eukprot:MONOS_7785.2-p1 / transcript=MONOS_7785.2 / gene=MONOS_7785 / organism=Monocercomonoides_exilis_PA203 / gene_product=unspecified product / transcript_product=unspecified product / location=Mono_scaffold00275:64165-65519(+) / protein_length=432 / sequence_SO=supercontig / SO=protein_coding / is_pseudo=false